MLSRKKIKHRIMQGRRDSFPEDMTTPKIARAITGYDEENAALMGEVWRALVELACEGKMRLVGGLWQYVEEDENGT
jgi:hypothetical protein